MINDISCYFDLEELVPTKKNAYERLDIWFLSVSAFLNITSNFLPVDVLTLQWISQNPKNLTLILILMQTHEGAEDI